MTPHVIGIDGGGGHTSACLLNAQTGAILATGDAGPSNIHGVGLAEGAQAIVKALMWKERLFQQRFSAAYAALCPGDPVLHPSISLALGATRLALETLGIRPNSAWGSFSPPKQVGVGALSQGEETGDGICLSPASDDEAPSPANDTLARNRRIFEECRNLLTEQLHPEAKTLDRAEVGEILRLMNREDARVAPAVGKVLPQIAQAVEWVTETFRNGGRLFYAGAGTSGRLGCLDAAECPPTFGAPPHLVQPLIAGGVATLLRSREGAEDLEEDAPHDLDARGFAARDILVGLAASSRTPYVLSALGHAHRAGARTALVTCNPPKTPLESVDLLIAPVVGPEVVMGSTRLKAATAQKMILNMLTTASMIRMGKVYDGMMVDLQMSCGKLAERAKRIVMMLTGLEYEQAADLLRASGGSVKTALVMHFRECSAREAARLLDENEGFVRRAIEGYARES
jgi:N-acetylmuramic acid 6-phosphate etherase